MGEGGRNWGGGGEKLDWGGGGRRIISIERIRSRILTVQEGGGGRMCVEEDGGG